MEAFPLCLHATPSIFLSWTYVPPSQPIVPSQHMGEPSLLPSGTYPDLLTLGTYSAKNLDTCALFSKQSEPGLAVPFWLKKKKTSVSESLYFFWAQVQHEIRSLFILKLLYLYQNSTPWAIYWLIPLKVFRVKGDTKKHLWLTLAPKVQQGSRHGPLAPATTGIKKKKSQDFPDGPVVKTLHFHCRGHRFDPWLGN